LKSVTLATEVLINLNRFRNNKRSLMYEAFGYKIQGNLYKTDLR